MINAHSPLHGNQRKLRSRLKMEAFVEKKKAASGDEPDSRKREN